jgi:hypothetical protein
MNPIDFWKSCDDLRVCDAALLVMGCNPSDHSANNAVYNAPKGYDAVSHAIVSDLESGKIEGKKQYIDNEGYSEDNLLDEMRSTVSVESLKQWMQFKGLTMHFFFFPDATPSAILDPNHPRYSPKLAATTRAWEALDTDEDLNGKTPKQAAQIWLRKHAQEFGLSDEDGKLAESVIDNLAKIVNWQTQGGAPKTPSNPKPIQVKKESKAKLSVMGPPTQDRSVVIDDDIPF